MPESDRPSRRAFLGGALATTFGAVLVEGCALTPVGGAASPTPTPSPAPDDDDAPCEPTSEDIEGPFWREEAPFREDLNPLGVAGLALTLRGRILSEDCRTPVEGAVVDVWQADPDGAYDNESEAFAFRGRAVTDAEGRYAFRTLVPGRYLNGDQYRPAHVHYKVTASEHAELTTQLYFEDDPFNEVDPWFEEERSRPALEDGDGLAVDFELSLQRS